MVMVVVCGEGGGTTQRFFHWCCIQCTANGIERACFLQSPCLFPISRCNSADAGIGSVWQACCAVAVASV